MSSIAELPIVQSLARQVRQHGWRNTLLRAILRLLAATFGVRILRGLVAEAIDPAGSQAAEGYAQGFAVPRAVRRFSADPANEMTPFFVADALARGDHCYAICDGTVPVSTSWYSTRPTRIGLGDLVLHFAPRYVYMYKAHTQPSHRGRRLHAAGVGKALQHYAARGALGFVTCVDATNLESLKACLHAGYRVFGSIRVIRFFGRHFVFASRGCRAFHFKLENHPSRRDRPQRFHPAATHANVPVV